MRVQFKGSYSFEEVRDAMETLILNLSQNNVDTLMSLNFYFTPANSGASVVLTDTHGLEIDHLVINPDLRQPFKAATDELYISRLKRYPDDEPIEGEN